jgi:exodeoxyribonuclease-3
MTQGLTIKIATWNVNSINARIESFISWVRLEKPDIILLQELKCTTENFPHEAIDELGYNKAIFGQKSYNGVAILSKYPIDDVCNNLPNFPDQQSRYIEAVISLPNKAIRVASVYVPNGGVELIEGQGIEETEKFQYKMNFFDKLSAHLEDNLRYNEIFIVGGDFNVAINDSDVFDPIFLKNSLCFHDNERKKFRAILNSGYGDLLKNFHKNGKKYSWWDYRGNSLELNKGYRIDYILGSPRAQDFVSNCYVDKRAIECPKRSDHAPVVCDIPL